MSTGDAVDWGHLRPTLGRFVLEWGEGLPIGRDGAIRVNYFLDLLSACHLQECREPLVQYFAKWLQTRIDLRTVDAIIGPKRGNTLFAKAVADLLGKKSGFVRDNILFGRWVEGDLRPADRIILVDDVASEGEMLCDAVESLREMGMAAKRAFVFVDRPEGDAGRQLRHLGLQYEFSIQLSDQALAELSR